MIGNRDGLGTNLDFGGHGIGRTMHEKPHVPNGGRPGRGLPLQPGLVIAIEPWFWRGPTTRYVIRDAAGRCAPATAAAAHMPSTPSRSPPTASRPDRPLRPS